MTRYEDVRALFADERLGRSHPEPERAPRVTQAEFLGGATSGYETEKEDHARMRRLMAPPFSARRVQGLQPRIQRLVDGLLDQLAASGPPADLHETLSVPLPLLVICDLLGVPYEDRDTFRRYVEDMACVHDRARGTAGRDGLHDYMADLIETKRYAAGENVIRDFVAARDAEQVSTDEMVTLAMGLLFAGHETTVTRIDWGVLLLFDHPDQLEALRRDPGLAPGAVEEILRMAAPSAGSGLPRYAGADIEIGGVTIAAGDLVLLSSLSANRDSDVIDDPDRFDITRPVTPHLTFGFGPRFCVGATLARIELQAVFGVLFQRFPTLRLAVPLEQVPLRRGIVTGGVTALPVAW
ncbi:MAG TPA: cytochrome P450 [Mycobacteriales bacterium]|nr:cytochrome P450 [Mycobacteriales bacterium]